MNTYLINVERDSVCVGDDIDAPHEYSFSLNEDSSLNDIFTHLEKKRYLAGVAGTRHSWDAIIDSKKVAHFKGNNRVPEPSKLLKSSISKFVKNGQLNVKFSYNSAST